MVAEAGGMAEPAASYAGTELKTWDDGDLIAWIVAAAGRGRVAVDTSRAGFAFSPLISVPELVARQTSAEVWLSLVRDGSVLGKDAWTLPEGSPDARRVEDAYRAGYSLVMRRLHLRVPAVSDLAHRLDAALGDAGHILRRAVRSNLFATPAGAKGVALHHDDHEVAVLQLSGTKRWTVHEPAYRFPLGPPDRHLDAGDCRGVAFEGVLHPGSVLLVPRGFPHQASTDDSPSVHITLGAEICTWLDVINAVATQAEPLRRYLPQGQVSQPPAGGLWRQLSRELSTLLDDDRMIRRALADLAEEGMRSAAGRSALADWNEPRPTLTPDTRVRRTAEALSTLVDLGGGDATLCTPTMRLDGSSEQRPLLDFLHTRREFVVAELPGDLGDDMRVELATRLCADRFLEIAGPDSRNDPR
jgi:ribosomal protein L16 Arg81 hydroxylase